MAGSDEDLIRRYILPSLLQPMKAAVLDSNHTLSVHTRPPNSYDRHLPQSLILRNLRFEPDMLIGFESVLLPQLLSRHGLVAHLKRNNVVPSLVKFIQNTRRMVAAHSATREDSISSFFDFLMQSVLLSATLALFDLNDQQLNLAVTSVEETGEDDLSGQFESESTAPLPSFFACVSSGEAEPIADKVIRLVQPGELELPPALSPYISMNPFLCIELKNILAADPRVYLSLLLLIAITLRNPQAVFPWAKATCKQCDAFSESHKALRSTTQTARSPQDAYDAEAPLLRASQRMLADLRDAISTAQEYIPKWDQLVGQFRRSKTGVTHLSATSSDDDNKDLSDLKTAMEKVFDEYDVKAEYRGSAKGWLRHAVYLTIQGWSHMVTHDTTFELVSGYQVSWVIRRHRASQSASISPFFIPNKKETFSIIVGIVIQAFDDALRRFDANGQQPSVDLFRKGGGGDATHTGQDESEGDKHPPKKKTKTFHPTSITASTSGSGQQQYSGDSLNLERLHLAFRVSECTLWSDGFTDMFRILKTQADTSSAPSSPPHLRRSSHPQRELRNTATTYSNAGLFLEHLIAQGAVGDVWAGFMVVEGTLWRQPVVAKMATTQRGRRELLREGDVYRYLAKQRPFGPKCYGVFSDTDGMTALILDHLGTALRNFDHLGVQAQHIYNEAKTLHEIGVCHNDLEPRNVLLDKGGQVHIIDFHVSEIGHKCHLPVGCEELQILAQRLGLQER